MMATCTPQTAVSKASNQSTLFSFMKKKDPSQDNDPKANLNFVTPASKDISPVKKSDVDSMKVEQIVDDGQDSDIERLVSHSSVAGTPAPAQSPGPVVDLTTDSTTEPTKKTNVVSAVKKRKPAAPKKKAPVVAISSVLSAMTPVAKEPVAKASEDADDDLEQWADEMADVVSTAKDSPSPAVAAPVVAAAVPVEDTPAPITASAEEASPAAETPVEIEQPAVKTPVPTKKRARKASAKKVEAVESAALDTEAAAEGAETPATDTADAADEEASPNAEQPSSETKAAPKRVRKPVAKAAPAEPVYSPEVLLKQEATQDKINRLIAELHNLESCPDLCDSQLDLTDAMDDLIAAATEPLAVSDEAAAFSSSVTEPVSETAEEPQAEAMDVVEEPAAVEGEEAEAATPTTPATPAAPVAALAAAPQTAEEKAKSRAEHLVRTLIARSIQGSPMTLKEVTALALASLKAVTQRLEDLPDDEDLSPSAVAAIKVVNDAVSRVSEPLALAEEVKVVAARTPYGKNDAKASVYESHDEVAVRRWNCYSTMYFSKAANATITAARALRKKYGDALRALSVYQAELFKLRQEESKMIPFVNRVAATQKEVESWKARRTEDDAKRAAAAEDKRRKDEIKEQKRLEKEEADRARKAALETAKAEKAEKAAASKADKPVVEKEKKTPSAHSEKIQKKAAELEKSKNMFMNFLKKAAPVASPAGVTSPAKAATSSASASSTAEVLDMTESAEDEKLARFEAAMATELAMSEIMKYQRERYQARAPRRKSTRPRKIDLHVTVIVPDPVNRGGFGGDNTYSEIQEKSFSNKVRTLSFWEDHRPAYVGTVSRTSRVISGRRPLARDTELLNYEYDSEEDWEEEVEGEDLNDTDEEEEDGGKDELEYDDFFRRDDDYGSDAEGETLDGAVKVGARNVVELFGPRFLSPAACPTLVFDAREENVDKSSQLKARRFESGVSNFSIFDLSTGDLVHRAVKADQASVNLSSYAAVSFATHPVPTLGQFESAATAVKEKKVSEKKNKDKEATSEKKIPAASSSSNLAEVSTSTTSSVVVVGETETPEVKAAPLRGFDESKMPLLARFAHGKKDGVDRIVAAFHELHPNCSKMQIQKRLKDMTDKVKHSEGYGTQRWIVKSEVLEKYNISTSELEEVIFTPQKKTKKRTATTLIASSVEELQAQHAQLGGTPVALFPPAASTASVVAAAEKSEAQEVPAVATAVAVAPAAVFSPAVSSSSSAKVNILVPKSKPKATAVSTTGTSAAAVTTAVTPSSGTKRKSDAPAVPKSAKKATTAESAQTAAVTPAPAAKAAPASGVKKITNFLFGAAQSKVEAPATESVSEKKEVEVIVVDEAQS